MIEKANLYPNSAWLEQSDVSSIVEVAHYSQSIMRQLVDHPRTQCHISDSVFVSEAG